MAVRSGEGLEGRRDLGERIDRVDMARELALRAPAGELIEAGPIVGRILPHEGAPIDATHVAAFEQHQVERQPGDFAGRKAHHQEAALPRDGPQGGFAQGPADRIIDDVDAVLAAEPIEGVLEILLGVVYALVCAMRPREGELVVARRAGDDACAHLLAELDCREPDASGRAEHRQRLAALEGGAVPERVIGGPVGDVEAGRAVEIEIGREPDELVDRHGGALSRRPEARVAQHPVAGRESGDAGAHAVDHAGKFAARRERQRRLGLIFSGDDQRVVEIEPDRLDAHHRLAGAGDRIRQVGEDEIVGSAQAGAENGFHFVDCVILLAG